MPRTFAAKAGAIKARAIALEGFNLLPDDAQVGIDDIALITGRTVSGIYQARHMGTLGLEPLPPQNGSNLVRFRVGNVRAWLRGERTDTPPAPRRKRKNPRKRKPKAEAPAEPVAA